MSAMEDGPGATAPARTRPGRRSAVVRLLVAGVLLGPCLGVAFGPWLARNRLPLYEARIPWQGPAFGPGDWPRPAGPGEGAQTSRIGPRTVLVARAPTAAGAEALALELALPRLSRSPGLLEARAGRREEWCAALLRGPAGTLSPAADCAARLRGWAEAWRAVAAAPATAARGAGGAASAASRELPVESEVARRALAADAAGLEAALEREARVARSLLWTQIGALPSGPREAATSAWRAAWGRRAAELDTLAQALVARKPRIERELVARVAPVHALDVEPRIPDPGVIVLLAASGSEPAAARPVAATWLLFAAAGSLVALLAGAPLARNAARARRARHDELMQRLQVAAGAFDAIPPAASAHVEARLQIVSGSRPLRVARLVRELAARHLAAGERVLVIDGGRHLRLHDSFDARPHLGFQECMRDGYPLLGVVQSGGLPGLHVLAHGAPARLGSWTPLGGLLDQARPYFSRVILALDPNVTRDAGAALAGRLMDGWWAGADPRSGDARRFSTRIGIALQAAEPTAAEHETLEQTVNEFARRARGEAAAPAAPSTPAAATPAIAEAQAAESAAASAPASAPAEAPTPASAPVTLEALMEELVRDTALERVPAPELAALDALVEDLSGAAAPTQTAAAAQVPAAAEEPVPAVATAPIVAPEPVPAASQEPAPAVAPRPTPVVVPEPAPVVAAEPAPAVVPEPAPVAAKELAPAVAVEPTPVVAPEPVPVAAQEPAAAAAPEPAPAVPASHMEPAGVPPEEPVVLESDPEVRERLRFLVWMRKLRDKNRGDVAHVR